MVNVEYFEPISPSEVLLPFNQYTRSGDPHNRRLPSWNLRMVQKLHQFGYPVKITNFTLEPADGGTDI
jgi:hypothetical protein